MTLLNMKPRRVQKASKPTLQDPKVVDNGHMTASKSQAKTSGQTCPVPNNKPFKGKVFYLDLPSKRAEALENDIKKLGGIVEKFFSKEIKYLVSNKREARYVQYLGCDSPVPSPDSGHSSPHPRAASLKDGIKASFHGQADTVVTSRGKSLVERVVKEQDRIQINKILSNALEWGVKILYIDDIIAYVEKKKRSISTQHAETTAAKTSAKAESTGRPAFQKYKAGRISKPFVKVEDSSRHYRPIYLALPSMPEFNLRSAPPCSPFYMEDKDHQGRKPRDHRTRKNREKKRGGYCECCMLKYDNIKAHFQSEQHRAFSQSDEYLVVDRLASALPFNFIHLKTHDKRPKCSISSVLQVNEETQGADANEMARALTSLWPSTEDPQDGESPPKLSPKHSSLPPPFSHSAGERRDCNDVPDRHQRRQRPPSRKRPCRQGSPHTPPPRTGLCQRPGSKAVREPSRGHPSNCDTDANPALSQGEQESQRSCEDNNRPALLRHGGDLQCVVPSASLAGKEEESPLRLGVCVAAGRSLLGKGEGVPECKESSTQTHSPSPAIRLRRKVRDFKRKRRKVDTQTVTQERGKTRDIPSGPSLDLWQLFQSSEDMDWEFRGFGESEEGKEGRRK